MSAFAEGDKKCCFGFLGIRRRTAFLTVVLSSLFIPDLTKLNDHADQQIQLLRDVLVPEEVQKDIYIKVEQMFEPAHWMGADYYALWLTVNDALVAAAKHFDEVPNVPIYRLLPLLKAQFDFFSHLDTRSSVLADEFAEDPSTRNVSLGDLQALDVYLALSAAAYESADFIREVLAARDFVLVQHEPNVGRERPGYFIALNAERREVVVAVRGTAQMADLITDCTHTPVPFIGDAWAHSGILESGLYIVNRTTPLVDNLFGPLNFTLTFTGHSLGAGVSQIAAMVFRWELGIQAKCVSFAPPPTVDHATSQRTLDFITAVVNDSDVIPRFNWGILAANAFILSELDQDMQRTGVSIEDYYKGVSYFEKIKEYRRVLEEHAERVGTHVDMHIGGLIVLLAATPSGLVVQSVSNVFPALRRLDFTPTMLTDHSIDSYVGNLEAAAKQLM